MTLIQWNKINYLFLVVFLSSCATYSPLPEDFQSGNTIDGVYRNKQISNPFNNTSFWDFINDEELKNQNDSLFVRLTLIEKKILQIDLLEGDTPVANKVVKVKLKKDGCYHVKKKFFIAPFFPTFWFYEDTRYRIVAGENSLILEFSTSKGGVFIFIASGSSNRYSLEYEKVGLN